ncbi:cbb3-type cytochrome oxidase assembly protein CcoS [Oceanospirillum maris]|uniref:cbb3-type cytochrome oxidase assembly protein CcoS n=1 Tax=Oceanospirillum maris TaxID=64977 RepID=UPI0003F617EA|nr:cbb3-type cytochrome oxidase assembly protein CcoS [Oceanospirillum maris]
MSILFLLIPLSLILLGIAIWAFFWAVDSDQFDDLSGPAYSILYDDDVKPHNNTASKSDIKSDQTTALDSSPIPSASPSATQSDALESSESQETKNV